LDGIVVGPSDFVVMAQAERLGQHPDRRATRGEATDYTITVIMV
jgi:hypothetical protein